MRTLTISLTSCEGEYPTCAATTTEATNDSVSARKRRGLLSAITTCGAVDAGFVAAGVVVLIVLAAYQQDLSDGVWRVSFGIGIVLPFALLFFRLRMMDSTQYSKHAMKDQIPYLLILKRYWRPMVGTTMAWFMYDFVVSTDSTRASLHFADLFCHPGISLRHIQFDDHLRSQPKREARANYWLRHCDQCILPARLLHRRHTHG